ncbi:pyruvate kinase [Parerythrobacter jejuensis]|uniref:Pyruvate kinase n=1 Tax=Parerythrobacter jejuensis TaxID=795812 RepID=A0A845AW88_9SPHN|nr:pyruvate kinase [Parerythrobacter jejuensis]MXP30673.1 pyruvate kinase [Parerythrobacter jejuensis]MXP33433.1 pyruvate kinase [Parerythrobacter jejuensis]
MQKLDPRGRKVKILATTGPASNSPEMLRRLFKAGADAFRVNMSHGEHAQHAKTMAAIRELEREFYRPVAILCDLQGPKLRVGSFKDGKAVIRHSGHFTLDRNPEPGDETRVELPHPELFGLLEKGQRLLINDGKIRLRVIKADDEKILCSAEVGGVISDRKGVNVPDAEIPIPALTEKDRKDLAFAMENGADWIGLSFVQRPEDLAEARKLMVGPDGKPRGALCAKIEKPMAVRRLDELIEMSDGIMVARGDLGVELEPQEVPPLQKKIVNATRLKGKPVIVATQMLESMIESPAPTRAEVSDVANAVYDGADAVMLSAETAAGDWPEEAVTIMHKIAVQVEQDEDYVERVRLLDTPPDPTTADALSHACMTIADTVPIAAITVFTGSGSTARRVARERPSVPMLVLTPEMRTARRTALLWGAHSVATKDIGSFEEMIAKGKRMALRHGFGTAGSKLIALAGVPFGTPGSTNLLHVVTLKGDELDKRED